MDLQSTVFAGPPLRFGSCVSRSDAIDDRYRWFMTETTTQ